MQNNFIKICVQWNTVESGSACRTKASLFLINVVQLEKQDCHN